MLNNIGSAELIIVGLMMLFFLGGSRIPKLAKGVSEAIVEFKKAAKEEV